jgi:hypothetical protein
MKYGKEKEEGGAISIPDRGAKQFLSAPPLLQRFLLHKNLFRNPPTGYLYRFWGGAVLHFSSNTRSIFRVPFQAPPALQPCRSNVEFWTYKQYRLHPKTPGCSAAGGIAALLPAKGPEQVSRTRTEP